MSKSTENDQAKISRLSELLAELNTISKSVQELLFAPIAPVEETEYVECVRWEGWSYAKGKIYEVVNGYITDSRGEKEDYANLTTHLPYFKPSTREAYLAQEKAKIPLHNNNDIQPAKNTIAQTEPIKEERWKPSNGQLYYYVNCTKKDTVGSFAWQADEVDVDFYELGNCFKTKEAAQIAADKIKQLLKEL